ncbi:MAG TPA: DinB family protein [Gemmatimonadaceae bacterium]|nr:DinB family protein [Gemmatimonadaceae bacterium]
MTRFPFPVPRVVALLAFLAGSLEAQDFRKDLIAQLDDTGNKLGALVNAFPKEKMSWRPQAGAPSVSETFMHVVRTNLTLPSAAGVAAAMNVRIPPGGDTTIVDRARIADMLAKSFVHAKDAVTQMADAKLEGKVTLAGAQLTRREVLVKMGADGRADLEKLIEYAAANSVALPWGK